MMSKNLQRLSIAFGLTLLAVSIGLIGYTFIEGYEFTDALYMAVITFSTVGFQEVKPLSDHGQIFTSLYILVNLGIYAYLLATLTTYLFEGELNKILNRFMIARELKKISDHVIVCGMGRNGTRTIEELERNKTNYIVIERNEEALQNIPESKTFHYIIGDATTDETLKKARIEYAKAIISTLPSDADNVFIALTAKELNPDLNVIARASDENAEKKLFRAGANHTVMPDALGGIHMAHIITKPYVVEFLNMLNGIGTQQFVLEEISYKELKPEYKDRSIRELDIRNKTGVTIIGFKDVRKGMLFSPEPNTRINKEDVLIVLGKKSSITTLKKVIT